VLQCAAVCCSVVQCVAVAVYSCMYMPQRHVYMYVLIHMFGISMISVCIYMSTRKVITARGDVTDSDVRAFVRV